MLSVESIKIKPFASKDLEVTYNIVNPFSGGVNSG
jgi:hypothetical protein